MALNQDITTPQQQTAGSSQPSVSTNQQSTNQQSQNPSKQGSGFVNLSQYLNANQNNNLAGKVGQGIQGQEQQYSQGINNATQNFNQGLNSFNTSLNTQNQANQLALSQIASGNTSQLDPNAAANYSALQNQQYTGPQGLDQGATAQLGAQAQNLQQQGQALGTETGRQGLLQQYVGAGKQYNPGAQRLDQFLLDQQANTLTPVQQSTQGLGNQLTNASNAANVQAQTAQSNLTADQQAASTGVANQSSALNTALNNQVSSDTAAQQAALTQIQGDLASGKISPQEAQELGLQSNVYQLYGVNPQQYLQAASAPGISNVANSTQAAQIAALAQLTGQVPGQVVQGYTAGQAQYDPTKPVSFNAAQFQQAIGNAAPQYSAAQATLLNQPTDVYKYLNQNSSSNPTGTDLGREFNITGQTLGQVSSQLAQAIQNYQGLMAQNGGGGAIDQQRLAQLQQANSYVQSQINNSMASLPSNQTLTVG